jgi:hypothetical protein
LVIDFNQALIDTWWFVTNLIKNLKKIDHIRYIVYIKARCLLKGGIMKSFILTVFTYVLFTGVAFAQDFPDAGKWKLQVIGTVEEFAIEINGTTWIFEINNNKVPQVVTVDNEKKTVTIPLLTGIADYYFFETNDDHIDLKAGGKFNIPLLESIRNGMTDMEGINDITDDFVGKILIEIETAFYKVPIMRLYKN